MRKWYWGFVDGEIPMRERMESGENEGELEYPWKREKMESGVKENGGCNG